MARRYSQKGYGSVTFVDTEFNWAKHAKCKGMDTNLFFPEGTEEKKTAKYVNDDIASLVCGRCPVVDECRDFAMKHDLVGIWGGTIDYTRHQLVKSNFKVSCPGCRSNDIFKEHDGSSICASCGLSWT